MLRNLGLQRHRALSLRQYGLLVLRIDLNSIGLCNRSLLKRKFLRYKLQLDCWNGFIGLTRPYVTESFNSVGVGPGIGVSTYSVYNEDSVLTSAAGTLPTSSTSSDMVPRFRSAWRASSLRSSNASRQKQASNMAAHSTAHEHDTAMTIRDWLLHSRPHTFVVSADWASSSYSCNNTIFFCQKTQLFKR